MESAAQLTPVYSYQKFKELADDRMSQVKVFIQTAESWESAGSGTIQFFQVDPGNAMREVKTACDFSPQVGNFYLLIETADPGEISLQEKQTLFKNREVFKSKEINSSNVIVFYDLFVGFEFEYDIERYFIRKSYQLGAQTGRLSPSGNQLCIRWDLR